MRASLAVLVLAAALTAHADDLDGWQFRVISVTRAEPAKQEAATVISEPEKLAAAEPADSGFYVVMFSARWCGPCQAYKRTTLPQLRERQSAL